MHGLNAYHPQKLNRLDIWFHLPIDLAKDPCEDLLAGGWQEKTDLPDDMETYTYFYRFVAEALWGSTGKNAGAGRSRAVFRRFEPKSPGQVRWVAEMRQPAYNETLHDLTHFKLRLFSPKLWLVTGEKNVSDSHGLAILSLRVRVRGVRKARIPTNDNRSELCSQEFQELTLADGLNALDFLRRTFARWRDRETGLPGDALSAVFPGGGVPEPGKVWEMPSKMEHDEYLHRNGTPMVAPWVEHLLAPLKINGDGVDHFGDERAFMTSVVAVETPKGMSDRMAFQAIHDGAFFRLAEADRGGPGYAYQTPFLNELRDTYFYDRHAPDPKHDYGNTTRWITASHHLCGVGTGSFMVSDAIPHAEKYYSILQMLCIFEYYRLLQFSQRLSRLVQHKEGMVASDFRAALLAIREEFLSFTHLHHFTNVSHQLQPAEIFTRLSHAMGLDRMWREVADELQSAAEYAALQEQDAAAKRAERLNNIVAMGVPASLVVGVLGMNVMVGDRFPGLVNHWFCPALHPIRSDMFQFALVSLGVLGLWFALERWIGGKPELEARPPTRRLMWLCLAGLIALLSVVSMSSVAAQCEETTGAETGKSRFERQLIDANQRITR